MSYNTYKKEMITKHGIILEDFNPDGRHHFIYRLTYNINRMHYYGSKTSKNKPIDVIGKTYFTSSKYVEPIFRNNPNNFKIKIIKIFDNKMDKQLFESFIHKKLNVKVSDKFFNKSNQTPNNFDTTGYVTVSSIDNPDVKFNISIEEYNSNKKYYLTTFNDKVAVKSDNKYKLISKKEFQNNRDKYVTPSQNTVTCYDTILKKHVQIATEEYFSNRDKYKHFAENKVQVYNENGEIVYISSEEYKNGNYKSILTNTIPVKNKITGINTRIHKDDFDENMHEMFSKNKIVVYDKSLDTHISINTEEYHKNKQNYKCFGEGIPVTDIRTDEYKIISSEEYQNNKEFYKTNVHGTKKVIDILTDKIITINVKDYDSNMHKPMLSDYVYCYKENKRVGFLRYKDFKNGNYVPAGKKIHAKNKITGNYEEIYSYQVYIEKTHEIKSCKKVFNILKNNFEYIDKDSELSKFQLSIHLYNSTLKSNQDYVVIREDNSKKLVKYSDFKKIYNNNIDFNSNPIKRKFLNRIYFLFNREEELLFNMSTIRLNENGKLIDYFVNEILNFDNTLLSATAKNYKNNYINNNINTNKESFLYLNLVDLNIEKNNI